MRRVAYAYVLLCLLISVTCEGRTLLNAEQREKEVTDPETAVLAAEAAQVASKLAKIAAELDAGQAPALNDSHQREQPAAVGSSNHHISEHSEGHQVGAAETQGSHAVRPESNHAAAA